ncbi:MAG: Holliday junction resolvase RuvX [Chitinophagales bacterium]
MARILCIDYGKKRTGIAVTDPLKIIASGLTTVESPRLISFLKEYFSRESVEMILIGEPHNLNHTDTDATAMVRNFISQLHAVFPSISIKTIDERFTSKLAARAMLDMGMKKKQRQKKELIDEIAATIMLQEYLDRPF